MRAVRQQSNTCFRDALFKMCLILLLCRYRIDHIGIYSRHHHPATSGHSHNCAVTDTDADAKSAPHRTHSCTHRTTFRGANARTHQRTDRGHHQQHLQHYPDCAALRCVLRVLVHPSYQVCGHYSARQRDHGRFILGGCNKRLRAWSCWYIRPLLSYLTFIVLLSARRSETRIARDSACTVQVLRRMPARETLMWAS